MAKCQRIRRKKRRICVGDMNERITINDRDWEPQDDAPTGKIVLSNPIEVWSMVATLIGTTTFDEVNDEQVATHDFFIRYMAGVTAEKWVTFRDRVYDILRVEELDGRRDFIRLRCNERGGASVAVNLT